MIKDFRKTNNQLKPIAQAPEFYVLGIKDRMGIKDRISQTSEGLDTFKDWSRPAKICSVTKRDGKTSESPRAHCYRACTKIRMKIHSRYRKVVAQTIIGVEIDTDSDEFQAWYLAFTSFPPSALLESQAKLNDNLGRHLEDTHRTGRKKQGPLYAVELWRDIEIVLQNKLTKIKSKLRTNLAMQISKPIRSHKQLIHAREAIESKPTGARTLRPGLSFLVYHKLFPNLTLRMNPMRAATWQWQ
jgi:hypothetical protein